MDAGDIPVRKHWLVARAFPPRPLVRLFLSLLLNLFVMFPTQTIRCNANPTSWHPPYPKPKLIQPQPFLPPHSRSPDHLAPISSHPILSPIQPTHTHTHLPWFIPTYTTTFIPPITPPAAPPLCLRSNQTLTLVPIHSTITPPAPILSTHHIPSISMINADQNHPTLLPPHLPHPMSHTQNYQPGLNPNPNLLDHALPPTSSNSHSHRFQPPREMFREFIPLYSVFMKATQSI